LRAGAYCESLGLLHFEAIRRTQWQDFSKDILQP
jgi:hypothetical protein